MRTTAVLAFALALAGAFSARGQGYTRVKQVLIPISVADVPGANGSLWTSELWAVNGANSDGFAVALPCRIEGADGCPASELPPSRSMRMPVWGNPEEPGVLLMVTPGVSFTLHVRDKSRSEQSWGAEIPVVREEEFLTEDSHLTGIPAGPAWRQTLRVYAINKLFGFGGIELPLPELTFEVKLYAVTASGDQLLRQTTLRVPPGSAPPANQIPSQLWQTTLTDLFAGTAQYERLRVSIEPGTGGFIGGSPFSYWAFVSVTNNETQQVTTVVAR